MIRGCGVDIVEISRIERLVERYGELFVGRVFTPEEAEFCRSRGRPAVQFAGRWAVKEAFYKALPDGCQRLASWKSIEVLPSKETGRPVVRIVDSQLGGRLEHEGIGSVHVSLSHERSHCVAVVILE